MRTLRVIVVGFLWASIAGLTPIEAAPTTINYQGLLTDSSLDRTPISGELSMEFRLYGSAGGADLLWNESWPLVDVNNGIFSVLLGSNGALLPPAVFETTTLHLEVIVNGETLAPRTPIGSVGYAHQSERVGALTEGDIQGLSVPSGVVEFFDLAACPPGWSDHTTAGGRVLVGLPPGGTAGGTVGTALADGEDRGHIHTVASFDLMTSAVGGHSHLTETSNSLTSPAGEHEHSVNPPSTETTTDEHDHQVVGPISGTLELDAPHSHFYNPNLTYSQSTKHRHVWAYHTSDHQWRTWLENGAGYLLVDWGNGMDTAGAGEYPISTSSTSWVDGYTQGESHSHSFDLPGIELVSAEHDHDLTLTGFDLLQEPHSHFVDVPTLSSSPGLDHQHTLDLTTSTTSVAGAHEHTATAGSTVTSTAFTSDALPYVELLVCKKD